MQFGGTAFRNDTGYIMLSYANNNQSNSNKNVIITKVKNSRDAEEGFLRASHYPA